MFIREELNTGIGQFHTHHEREEPSDQTGNDSEDQIERADILMVGRIEPPRKETGFAVIIIRRWLGGDVFTRKGYHCSLSYFCAAVIPLPIRDLFSATEDVKDPPLAIQRA